MFPQQIIQGGFQGLGALGADSQAALRGSVVDVSMEVSYAHRVLAYTSSLTASLVSRLNSSGFKVLNIDDSGLGSQNGGVIRVRVQVLTDGYGSAQDAASVVAGAASYLGFNVTGSAGAVAGTVTGGASGAPGLDTSGQTFNPATVPGAIPESGGIGDLFSGLTSSPVSLAVIAGAAVLLLIAVKGK